MSPKLRLPVLAVLSFGTLCALCSSSRLTPLPDRADAALSARASTEKVRAAPRLGTAAVRGEPVPSPAVLEERLRRPPAWRPPTVRSALEAIPSQRTGAAARMATPSRTRAVLDAPTGSYATLRPRQLGEAHQENARLQGSMFTLLRGGYSLSLQQQENAALVPMSFDLSRGDFALHAESAGHYLVMLHLSNPSTTGYAFRNRLQRWEMDYPYDVRITTLVEQEDSIQGGASFVVPCLLQLQQDEWVSLSWYLQGGNVVFHALTVDRLG